LFII
jgi:hypothetical protein